MKAFSGDGLMDTGSLFFDPELSRLTTGRTTSLFAQDIKAQDAALRSAFAGRRILVTGGAGSIGSATLELLFPYAPAAVHVIDLAENGLVELVRDFRSRPEPLVRGEFRLLPIDYGSAATERLLQSERPYDLVLHFAAHKHVRSEKDVPSVIQMLDTNVVKMHRFTKWLQTYGHGKRYFAVSTDKAANPTSLMGASKRLMEHVLFSIGSSSSAVTSTRFANVAFSNGSLLQGFLYRLARRQPMAVPREVRRYFVSPREAAEICLLTAGAAAPGHISFPRLDPNEHLRPLVDIATSLLQELGLKASFYEDEEKACAATEVELKRGSYPVLLTPLDTSGEKPYEEFVAADETPVPTNFAALSALRYVPPPILLEPALAFLDEIVSDASMKLEKSDIARHVASVVPGFRHVETGRSLDDRT
ncbi:MAG TPA: polysaccharide biosynthesis protein [Bradyrhizobium sp.]|jgi:FlaA1/EpsC-like NDP-sugar epimerase|nr:polysaccharide biosynthesis protein [Bradyrhizobium sp.]